MTAMDTPPEFETSALTWVSAVLTVLSPWG